MTTPRKKLIAFAVACMLMILGLLAFDAFISYCFGGFDKDYSTNDLIENFNDKKTEIYDLKNYFRSITPQGKEVVIEFEEYKISRIRIAPIDTVTQTPIYDSAYMEWGIPIRSLTTDTILASLHWSESNLQTLQDKLKNAGCIGIESGDPTVINFQRSGMGMYSFNVFTAAIPDSMISHYNDSCRYIYVNQNLVLEYGGGAVGPQCFYKISGK